MSIFATVLCGIQTPALCTNIYHYGNRRNSHSLVKVHGMVTVNLELVGKTSQNRCSLEICCVIESK